MAEICRGVVSGSGSGSGSDESSREVRRRRMELSGAKRRRLGPPGQDDDDCLSDYSGGAGYIPILPAPPVLNHPQPKFGITAVCGRRREMEDAVAIHPSFYRREFNAHHFYGVYDGHGCSHVATKCKERLHEMVEEELLLRGGGWKRVMERSFSRMDKEVIAWKERGIDNMRIRCRCDLQKPECDAVGSTAVVAVVTPLKIIVANCGDSRAVLCRAGKALPLSTDHKPDRPDELRRIQAAGGRVINWDGARVFGVLAMSRAIGDNYLKPYVSSEPEVTVTERSEEDEFLILASDGLWDVVSNETACGVVRMCLKVAAPPEGQGQSSDNTCNAASMLLTKVALARRSTDNISVVVIDLRKAT